MSQKEAQEWLDQQTITVRWDRYAKLDTEGINALLRGGATWFEHTKDLYERNLEYISHLEHDLVMRAAADYEVEPSRLNTAYIGVDLNVGGLIRQSKAFVTVPLGIKHEEYGHRYKAEYEDRAEELKALGINPKEVDRDWPDISERDDPLVSSEAVRELWANNFYSGEWVALLDAQSVLNAAYEGTLDEYRILKATATVTIYDYWNGSGSVLAETERDIEIDPKEIRNDGANRYGIQACYGLVDSAWNGELEKGGIK